ncbi:MAG: hypothetical protein RL172_2160 [Bacteroidota bacterium]|jgi:hypothetical protein
MQIIKSSLKLIFFIFPITAGAQTTYLQQGDKAYQLLERMEIKSQKNVLLNFSTIRPYSRKALVPVMEQLDSAAKAGSSTDSGWVALTKTDRHNIHSFLMNNSEWVKGDKQSFMSRKPIFNALYKTKPNLFEVNEKDFFLAINPVLNITYGKESGTEESVFLNSRGITARGVIANKIGFSTTITDNQERGPLFFRNRVTAFGAVPGYGFYKSFKSTGVDYFDARGYITFNVTKYIDVQFGHDKNFIGHGHRSLFLSDWGNSYLFLKLNTRIWKFNYQNIFMELMPQWKKTSDNVIDRKYQALHHLSFNLSKSVNIGVFEAITFGRRNHFEFQYLNPIIFLRHIEGSVGSPDKAKAGFDFKANVAKRLQFYGQFLLDEFVLGKLRNDPTNYVNKYGYQLGVKYVDAFGIANLDLQAETNRVRPFVYSHRDSVSNYTHYNQPMAHPLGANFQEFIGILRYQPAAKWYIYARGIYYYQGLDSARLNFGSNPFRLYNQGKPLVNPADPNSPQRETGYYVGSGAKANCFNALVQVSYEIKENVFFDVTLQHRSYKITSQNINTSNTLIMAGLRINLFKRAYDF